MRPIKDPRDPQDSLKNARDYINISTLPEDDKALLHRYLDGLIASDGSKTKSTHTMRGAVFAIKSFAEFIKKPIKKITKDDIIKYVVHLQNKGLKEATREFYKMRIKLFYKWLDGKYTERVDWIKKVDVRKDLSETDLIQPSEIRKMVDVCDNARDKALISGLYESGARIAEWLGVKIKDIRFDEYGAKIKVTGKTGMRQIRLIDSVPYLTEWINTHPYKTDHERYVFMNFASNYYGRCLFAGTVGIMLRTYAKRAGVHKKLYPHLLRHSRLTWLAQKENFNERDLRIFAGWSSNSDMPNTYLHYGEEEVDKKLRKCKGVETEKDSQNEQDERDSLKPKECARCHKINPATALYCNCGMALNIKTVIEDTKKREEADSLMDELFSDNEFKEVFKEFMRKRMTKN